MKCPKCGTELMSENRDGDYDCLCGYVLYKYSALYNNIIANNLTDSEYRVYLFIQYHRPNFISPTLIGLKIGGVTYSGLQRLSSWASPICKSLVDKGLIKRNKSGHYAVK